MLDQDYGLARQRERGQTGRGSLDTYTPVGLGRVTRKQGQRFLRNVMQNAEDVEGILTNVAIIKQSHIPRVSGF